MAKRETIKVEYAGIEFEADARAARSFKVIRGLSVGGAEMFEALDAIFLGRSEDYAEQLDDDFADVVNLAGKAVEAAGAKN